MGHELLALLLLGLTLGLRHGIDWDHIAAIADISGSVANPSNRDDYYEIAHSHVHTGAGQTSITSHASTHRSWWEEGRAGFFLAEFYALGHAFMVIVLGVLAIWSSTLLPEWLDPLMERIVGVTLLVLGVWIFYSLWRYGSEFRLQSRWMVIFALLGKAWRSLGARMKGEEPPHDHPHAAQYGTKTAFGIGMIHGVGAETGSQALLLASAAGATSAFTGTFLLLAFTIGLLISNSFVAAFSTFGFVSSSTKRQVYVVLGVVSGVFSLVVGASFVMGLGGTLPNPQGILDALFGAAPAEI